MNDFLLNALLICVWNRSNKILNSFALFYCYFRNRFFGKNVGNWEKESRKKIWFVKKCTRNTNENDNTKRFMNVFFSLHLIKLAKPVISNKITAFEQMTRTIHWIKYLYNPIYVKKIMLKDLAWHSFSIVRDKSLWWWHWKKKGRISILSHINRYKLIQYSPLAL